MYSSDKQLMPRLYVGVEHFHSKNPNYPLEKTSQITCICISFKRGNINSRQICGRMHSTTNLQKKANKIHNGILTHAGQNDCTKSQNTTVRELTCDPAVFNPQESWLFYLLLSPCNIPAKAVDHVSGNCVFVLHVGHLNGAQTGPATTAIWGVNQCM